ncbi:MAG: hypothetical protein GEU75_11270 [Dehalococcoidia bacterium]|nr:hypothetical protein [Dehalococcoidia bacterium]
MRRQGISDEDVRLGVERAGDTQPSIRGRINYLSRYRDGVLRVTVMEEDGDRVVITVTLRLK